MQRLTGYGLRLASQLPVPGAVARDDDAPADVTITLQPAQLIADAPVYARTDQGLCFGCPGVASYRIAPESIVVVPDPHAPSDMVSGMLIATALPALLWLRGQFVLHAAAARLPGSGALAIAGASGSGKSTILAQLAAADAALIGDDTIAFDTSAGRQASGLGGGWFVDAGDARRFVAAPPGRSLDAVPIVAILVLEAPGDGERFARLDPVSAVTHLLASRHRPRVPALLGQTGETLRHATLLAAQIPLYSWRRPMGKATLTPTEWAMLKQLGSGREIE